MRLKKNFLSLFVVFCLVFSLGINTFALDDLPNNVNNPAEIVLGEDLDLSEQPPASTSEVTPPALEITPPALEVTPPALEVTPPALEVTPSALEVTPEAIVLAVENNPLIIKSVEVINGGDVQILYRPEVYKGVAENGEDPDKFYTTRREINLKDPRIFNVEFTVTSAGITNPQAFLDTIDFTYGGYPLSSWGNGKDLRGSTPIMLLSDKQIVEVADGYKVSASIRVNSPYGAGSNANAASNIPYNGYNGGSQGDFAIDRAQSGDNRPFFQFGPTNKGPGTYALEAVANEQKLAAANLHIGPYDEYHSWTDINEFCQSLIVALNGEPADVDAKPLGVLAKGTVVINEEGQFEEGDGVYVEVSILGYGLTDNYSEANKGFNNYSRYNAIWNVVVAKDASTVDDYLKPGGVKDQMNDNPQALIDKYKDADPEDIDLVLPYYQNNVHSDEVAGTDSMIHLINEMIAGGTEGKAIPYKTFSDDVISYNYRPSGNTNTGYSAFNNYVDPNAFFSNTSRTQTSINTSEILDKFIMVNTLCSNPDGKAAMRRVNRYGLDLNRDTVYATQPETIALTQDIAKWDPLMMLEWHGYVTQMLIEPCTAPHSQNYEPDLTLNNMIQLAYSGGRALTASTGYNRFHVPWDTMANGWDDGGNVYGPMFAMLYGCMGWTIEEPNSNSDSFETSNAINYGMLNELMYGNTAFYPGNVLNGSIDGKDSHEVDNKYASMRKSTVMNKLEFKLRGVQNIDSPDADKYFIDVVNGVGKYVGRARKDDGNGGKLPYFPDYLVIPSTPDTQFNVAEAYRTLDFTMRYGAKVSKTTEPITYNGITYPEGTYLYDMKQGRRNFINEIMSKGYDATNFASMYADIYCNFPDTRGFDCVEVWSPGLFDGKTVPATAIDKKADITGAPAEYVVFKSNSTDSVRFVNLLLSGRSSGPSFIDSKENVWMLRKSVDGVGTMSDYIIEAKNLDKIYALVDNPDLGLKGCQIEGKYISNLPKEAVKLVEPVISMSNTRNAATQGGAIYWALDDFLGFGSMKNADGTDYNGNSSSTVRKDANVALLYNTAASGILLDTIKNDKLGLVMVQSAASLTDANFGTGTSGAPTTGQFNDVALYGKYNVNDSLITANYANTSTIYARGNYFSGNIPAGSKILFKSKDGDAFIGGYQNTGGAKDVFQNKTTMFSTILKGGGITEKPVQSVTFGSNMFYRPHYQKYYPMLATAIFAGAAGILDDQIDPVINNIVYSKTNVVVSASDADSGIAAYSLYQWDAAARKFVLKAEQADGTFALTSGNNRYMIVAADYAGNETVKTFTLAVPAPFTLTFALNSDGMTYTATIPLVQNGLYSFDGIAYSETNTKKDCLPGTSYTGYVKYAETPTQHESAAVSDTKTTPKLMVDPVISPNGGSFGKTQMITISCDTEGASIYYTTDGTDPTSASALYTAPFSISATTTVKTIAVKDGQHESSIVTASFTKSIDTPAPFTMTYTLNSDGKTFTATIPHVENGLYSFDGITYSNVNTKTDCMPDTSYTGYAKYAETETQDESAAVSDTQTAPKLTAKPVIAPNGGSYNAAQTVTITCGTSDAAIHYTTNGADPTSTSALYTAPFSISATTTVKAIAVKDGMLDSAIVSATFTITFSSSHSSSGGSGSAAKPAPSTTGSAVQANPFTDVKSGDWFNDAVQYVNKNGLMKGTSGTLFSPHANTTRGMVVAILYRMAGSPAVTAANPFDDVAAGQYYTDAVIWASTNKIVTGYGSGKFGPDDPINREQMAAILMNYAKFKKYDVSARTDLSVFEDASSVSGWAIDALSWANSKGFVQGDGNKLMPSGNAERCQVAAMLQRFAEIYKN